MAMLECAMYNLTPEGRARKHAYYMATFAERFWAKVGPTDPGAGCRTWIGGKSLDGYGHVVRLGKIHKAHRIAWELTNGPIPEGMLVCHRCDNPPCCEVAHLFLGTKFDNNHDRSAKGRNSMRWGPTHPSSRLTPEQVLDIRARFKRGMGPSLAAEFGISEAHVYAIVRRRTWKHL